MQGSRRLIIFLALVIAAALVAPMSTSAVVIPRISTGDGTWVWQNPLPQGNDIKAGWTFDADNALVLGKAGTGIRTTDGGASWSSSPFPQRTPVDVDFTSSSDGFALGSDGDWAAYLYVTADRGQTWTEKSRVPGDWNLFAMDFASSQRGWVVGEGWSEELDSFSAILRTDDGGSSWTTQTLRPWPMEYFSVSSPATTTAFVGGNLELDNYDYMSVLLKTTDGSTWTTAFTTLNSEDPERQRGYGFQSMWFLDANTGWIAEQGNVYRTTDGGSTFTTAAVPGYVGDIGFADADSGWIVGTDWSNYYIRHSTDGGQTWTAQTLPAGIQWRDLTRLSVVSSSTAYVFGDLGVILRTVDHGATWERLGSGSYYELNAVDFGDASRGWAVGKNNAVNKGLVLRTTDGGTTWASQEPSTAAGVALYAVDTSGTEEAWAVGEKGTIRHTVDGGMTWESQLTTASTPDYGLLGVSFGSRTGQGWIVGYPGLIIHTPDAGQTWSVQPSGVDVDLQAVSAVDSSTAFAVGEEGTILVTRNGGSTWTTSGPSPDPYEYYASVDFTDANNGWVVGSHQGRGVLLRTQDGGKRWSRKELQGFEPTVVRFSDPLHGRVFGYNDVLYTENGGETWYVEKTGANIGVYGGASVDATHAWIVGTTGGILFANSGAAAGATTLAGPDPLPYDVTRVAVEGGTRFETAVKASQQAFAAGSVSTVVLATGRNWPDALGGAALAKAVNGPILLTDTNSIPSVVSAEITRLGATKVYILGSEAAVSKAVATALQNSGKTVTRIGGANRYETARMVASKAIELLGVGYDGTAFVATGQNFPDALAASPLSAAKGWPIYLFNPASSPAPTIASMTGAGVSRVRILGSNLVVPDATENSLSTAFGDRNVLRLEGANRYGTAAAIAEDGVAEAGLGWNGVGIATGTNFPDALAGGVMLGKAGSVMLLTPGTALATSTRETLLAHKAEIDTVHFLGGPSAVNQTVRNAVVDALR